MPKFLIILMSLISISQPSIAAEFAADSYTLGRQSDFGGPKSSNAILIRFYGSADGVIAETIDILRKAKRPTRSDNGWETIKGPGGLKVSVTVVSMEISLKPQELIEAAAGNRVGIDGTVYNLVHFGGPAAKFLTDSMGRAGFTKRTYPSAQGRYEYQGELLSCSFIPGIYGYSCKLSLVAKEKASSPTN